MSNVICISSSDDESPESSKDATSSNNNKSTNAKSDCSNKRKLSLNLSDENSKSKKHKRNDSKLIKGDSNSNKSSSNTSCNDWFKKSSVTNDTKQNSESGNSMDEFLSPKPGTSKHFDQIENKVSENSIIKRIQPVLVVKEKVAIPDPADDVFSIFLKKCISTVKDSEKNDMNKAVAKLKRRYDEVDSVHKDNEEFRLFLNGCIVRISEKTVYKMCVEVNDEIKRRIKKLKKTESPKNENIEEEQEIPEEVFSKEDEKKIMKLQKTIQLCKDRIKELEEREVDFEEEENSAYLKEDRYKRKMIELCKKLSELTSDRMLKAKIYKKKLRRKDICDEMTNIESVDEAIIDFINSGIKKVNKLKHITKPTAIADYLTMPDYPDILQIIKKINKEKDLDLSNKKTEQLAQTAFKAVGRFLKKQRICETQEYISSYADIENEVDPAVRDLKLSTKLQENKIKSEHNLNEIFKKYEKKQEGLSPEEIEIEINKNSDSRSDSEDEDLEHRSSKKIEKSKCIESDEEEDENKEMDSTEQSDNEEQNKEEVNDINKKVCQEKKINDIKKFKKDDKENEINQKEKNFDKQDSDSKLKIKDDKSENKTKEDQSKMNSKSVKNNLGRDVMVIIPSGDNISINSTDSNKTLLSTGILTNNKINETSVVICDDIEILSENDETDLKNKSSSQLSKSSKKDRVASTEDFVLEYCSTEGETQEDPLSITVDTNNKDVDNLLKNEKSTMQDRQSKESVENETSVNFSKKTLSSVHDDILIITDDEINFSDTEKHVAVNNNALTINSENKTLEKSHAGTNRNTPQINTNRNQNLDSPKTSKLNVSKNVDTTKKNTLNPKDQLDTEKSVDKDAVRRSSEHKKLDNLSTENFNNSKNNSNKKQQTVSPESNKLNTNKSFGTSDTTKKASCISKDKEEDKRIQISRPFQENEKISKINNLPKSSNQVMEVSSTDSSNASKTKLTTESEKAVEVECLQIDECVSSKVADTDVIVEEESNEKPNIFTNVDESKVSEPSFLKVCSFAKPPDSWKDTRSPNKFKQRSVIPMKQVHHNVSKPEYVDLTSDRDSRSPSTSNKIINPLAINKNRPNSVLVVKNVINNYTVSLPADGVRKDNVVESKNFQDGQRRGGKHFYPSNVVINTYSSGSSHFNPRQHPANLVKKSYTVTPRSRMDYQ